MEIRTIPGDAPHVVMSDPPRVDETFERERARQAELMDAHPDRFNGPLLMAHSWDGQSDLQCFETDFAWLQAIRSGSATSDVAGWALSVMVLVQQANGVWVWQVRPENVATSPGMMTSAASGYVEPDLGFAGTVMTELSEELGIYPRDYSLIEPLGSVVITDQGLTTLHSVWQVLLMSDAVIEPSEEVARVLEGNPDSISGVEITAHAKAAWSLVTG